MKKYFDDEETRSEDQRQQDLATFLPSTISYAKMNLPGYRDILADVDPFEIKSVEQLSSLPVMRKSDLIEKQVTMPPFGGLANDDFLVASHYYQSPGPIYEPGYDLPDWWRVGRFLHACGIGRSDIVQNCFSYHLTPAGHIFESGARAVGAAVLPAGTGNTDLQVRAAAHVGVTAYAGTPDYLKVLLDRAREQGIDLSTITRAAVGGGPLFPSLRDEYHEQGILCLQNYATADIGSIAYETIADEPMIVDEHVIVEIVTPGTGNPVEPGEVGEVVVTTLRSEYSLIRFATGDLSAFAPGQSPCGRTNVRIVGWRGRADQTIKVKGMFVHPEQVAQLVASDNSISRARVVVTRENEMDRISTQVETDGGSKDSLAAAFHQITRLRCDIEIVPPGTLPRDGKVIDDQREYG